MARYPGRLGTSALSGQGGHLAGQDLRRALLAVQQSVGAHHVDEGDGARIAQGHAGAVAVGGNPCTHVGTLVDGKILDLGIESRKFLHIEVVQDALFTQGQQGAKLARGQLRLNLRCTKEISVIHQPTLINVDVSAFGLLAVGRPT